MNDLENNFCFIPESCERNFRRNFDILYLGSPPIYFLFKNILNQNWQTEQTEFPQISNIKNRSNQTSTYLQNTSMSSPPCSLDDTRDIYDTVCGLIELWLSDCHMIVWCTAGMSGAPHRQPNHLSPPHSPASHHWSCPGIQLPFISNQSNIILFLKTYSILDSWEVGIQNGSGES